MKYLFLFLAAFLQLSAHARVGELIVWASDQGGYPAEAMCFFSNSEMVIHQDGILAKYTCLGKEDIYGEVWYVGPDKKNKLLLRSQLGHLIGDTISRYDKVFMTEFDEGQTIALWEHDLQTPKKHELPAFLKRSMIQDIAFFKGTSLWMRIKGPDGLYQEGVFDQGQWSLLPERGVSFHFASTQTESFIAQVVRLGAPGETEESRPDYIQIRRAPEYKAELILGDKDSDPASPFKSFRNIMSSQGKYWFIIARTDEGEVAIRGEGLSYEVIPLYKQFKTLDYWQGTLLNDGSMILRGTLHDGTKGLWLVKENSPMPIIVSTDSLEVSEGTFSISNSMFYNAPISDGTHVFIGLGIQNVAQGIFKFKP